MADKSFGDHTNRGVVKNPLLSNVVTGLSLDDLTQKAVLLPVSPTSGVIVGSGEYFSLFIMYSFTQIAKSMT